MKTPTEKPSFFDRYSKTSRPSIVAEKAAVNPRSDAEPVDSPLDRPASERLYFYGVPPGLTDMQKLVLREMDRIGRTLIRAEMVRRFGISAASLNSALVALDRHKLVERSLRNGRIRYALLEPPANCVFARKAGDADAIECLRGQELTDELARKPKAAVVKELPAWRVEAERKAKTDRANQAIVLNAIRRAEAVSGVAELRPFLPSDHPQLPDHLARKAFKQLLDVGTIVERKIRLTPRRCAVVYTLVDASNGSERAGDATRSTQASGTAWRA
jgi:Fe2+ or Zn2+ uptake regulation protein